MVNPPSTRHIKKNDVDLRMMRVREQITKIQAELVTLPEAPKDPVRTAARLALNRQLMSLRQELMASLGATKKL